MSELSKDQPVDEPTIEWLIDQIAPNKGNSPLLNFNKKRLLKLIQAECNRARLQELYDWKNNSPAGREGYVDNRIKKLQQLLKEGE